MISWNYTWRKMATELKSTASERELIVSTKVLNWGRHKKCGRIFAVVETSTSASKRKHDGIRNHNCNGSLQLHCRRIR